MLLVSAFLAQGCANYHLGAGPAPSFSTLYVEPAKNKTMLAQTQVLVTTMVREAFVRDGRVSVVDSSLGRRRDARGHARQVPARNAANREDDNGLARKFTLRLTASLQPEGQPERADAL